LRLRRLGVFIVKSRGSRGVPAMKITYAAISFLLIATPAFSGASKTDKGVIFTCEVTGSDKDGFSLYAKNTGTSDRSCSATCQLTASDGKKRDFSSDTRPVRAKPADVRGDPARIQLEGQAGIKDGKPFSNADITKASCS
jgi:hypothetical protein